MANGNLDISTLLNYGNRSNYSPTNPVGILPANTGYTGTNQYSPVNTSILPAEQLTGAIPGDVDSFSMLDTLKSFGGMQGMGKLLGVAGQLYGAYNSGKQLDLSKDAFNFGKQSYNRNMGNQAQTINTRLQDRQNARVRSTGNNNSGGVYESVGDYMKKNRVDGSPL